MATVTALERIARFFGSSLRHPIGPMGRLAGLAAAVVCSSLLLALGTVMAPRSWRLDVGGPADARFVSGAFGVETLAGRSARWTGGDGIVRMPRGGPFAAQIVLTLLPHPGRPADQIQVIVDNREATRITLGPGWQSHRFDVAPATPNAAPLPLRIVIRSLTTSSPEDARPLGVGLDAVELATGGTRALRGLAARGALAWLTLLFAGILFAASAFVRLTAPLSRRRPVIVAACAGVLAAALLVALRFAPVPGAARLAAVAWLVALAVLAAVAASAVASHLGAGRDTGRLGWLPFGALAGLALAALFSDAWTRGWVLSQAGLIYQFAPWSLHAPPGPLPAANPLLGDIPMVFYPFLSHTIEVLRQGHVPLWTPAIFAGHPFFASFQSALLSPFTLIALVVPLPAATVVIAVARLLVGGIGMFVFVRALGLGRPAATFAGLAFLLNPFSVVWLEHPVSAVSAWLPWVLWAVERSVQRPGARRAAALSAVTALSLLAGHPETCLKVFLLAAAWGLVRTAASPHQRPALMTLAVGSALGVAAAAVQLVPFVEYLQQSRAYLARSQSAVNPFFAPALTAVTAVVPDFFGHPIGGSYLPMTNRYGLGANYCEQQVYAAIATWLLAATGLVARWRDHRTWFFAGAGLVGALLMYGTPVVADVLRFVPLLKVTALSRFGLVVIAAAIVLAAFGVEALVGRGANGSPRQASPCPPALWLPPVIAALAAAMAVAACLAWCRPMMVREGRFDATLAACATAALLAVGTLALVRARAHSHISPSIFAAGAWLLLVVDLLGFGRGFHPMVPASLVYPRVPEIDAISSDQGLFRVFGIDNHLVPNSALVYGLQDPRGYDGMWPARYSELLDAGLGGYPPFHRTSRMEDPRLLDLLNVKYVIAPPDARLPAGRFTRIDTGPSAVYRNERALPRAFLVNRYLVRNGNPARRILRDGREDPRRVVLLERDLPAGDSPDSGPERAGSASVTHYRDTFVEIATESPRRSLLVLTDAHYPGWQATVDGAPATIYRANFAFRAVSVPAGRHAVQFRYRPRSVMIGALITLAGLAAIACLVVFGRRVDSRGKPSQPPADLGADGVTDHSARPVHQRPTATPPSLDLTILVLAGDGGEPLGLGPERAGDALGDAARSLGISCEVVVSTGAVGAGDAGERPDRSSLRYVWSRAPGLAAAFRAGVDASAGAFVLTVDASCAPDPGVVARLWERRLDGGVVIAARAGTCGAGLPGAWRRLLHWATVVIVGRGLSLRLLDPTAGLRLYRREALERLQVGAAGPSFLVETLVQLNADGWEIAEVPNAGPGTARGPGVTRLLAIGLDILREFPRLWRMRNSPFSADYDDRAFDSLIPLQRYWQRTRHARVKSLLGDADRVLDVGCGSSRIILGLPHAVGVDIQLKKLRRVRQAARRLVQATLTRLPFCDNAFDAIICSQVIEHVAPSEVDWAEFARVLAPGGIFVVGTPDYATLTWRVLEWVYLRVHPHGYSTEHVNQYTAERLRGELQRAGFELTGQAYVGGGELIVRARKR